MSVLPPDDWSDEAGWDAYHQAEERKPDPFKLGLQYVSDLRKKGIERVWFPGCGTSLGPRAYAELGFEVLCSDFSSVSVAAQQRFAASELPEDVVKMLAEHRDNRAPRQMTVRRHDFRHQIDTDPFDLILNVRAFQGLSVGDMHAAAKSHFDAVKPGGWTIFDTMNVQGELRDQLEDALAEVGYEIPFRETQRWYRSALRATGVEFVMILGRPLARSLGKSKKDQKRLDAVSSEYRTRAEKEAEATRVKLASPDVKIAHVVYSTG